MKTPDQIKKALGCCADSDCRNCPYKNCDSYDECTEAMAADAFTYIEQLEKELAAHKWYNGEAEFEGESDENA